MKNKIGRKTNKTTARGIWKLHSDRGVTPIKFEEQKEYITENVAVLFRPKTEEVEKFISEVYDVEEMSEQMDYDFEHDSEKGYVGTLLDVGYMRDIIELFEFIQANKVAVWTGTEYPVIFESEGLEVILAPMFFYSATSLLEGSVFLHENELESEKEKRKEKLIK